MKALKLIAGFALAALLVSNASAQQVIRIAGANALRKPLNLALRAVIANNANGGLKYAYSSQTTTASEAAFTGASPVVITGTTVGGRSVIIQTDVQGSLAGDRDLVGQLAPPVNRWLSPTLNTLTPTGAALGGIDTDAVKKDASPGAPNLAIVDQPQGATAYTSAPLEEIKVGVVVYGFARGNGSSSSITNITNQLAKVLISSGQINLSQFTGNDADTQVVSWIGRDAFAGVRLVTFAETGFGITSTPTQFETFPSPTLSTGLTTGTITAVVTSGSFSGATGYTSNNTLVNQLRRPIDNVTAGHLIGAAGMPDLLGGSPNIETSGGKVLSFNGVPYTDNNVRNGSYSFWSYGYLSRRSDAPSLVAAIHVELAEQVKTEIATLYASSPNQGLLTLDSLKVARDGEGTPIYAK